MAQNGFSRRSNTASTRTYPGTASRLVGSPLGSGSFNSSSSSSRSALSNANVASSGAGGASAGSEHTIFVRPLSRSQLAPVHAGAGGHHNHHPHPVSTTGGLLMDSRNIPLPPTPPTRPISLDQPRPNSERHRNLYLGAPILPQNHHNHGLGVGAGAGQTNDLNSSSRVHSGSNQHSKNHRIFDSSLTAAEQVRLPTNSKKKLVNNNNTSSKSSRNSNKNFSDRSSQGGGDEDDDDGLGVVTSQPTKRSLLGEDASLSMDGGDGGNGMGKVKLAESSIVCPYCRKCRCEACATPRPLPSRWICSKSIHCGPEPLLDYVTCLCCVKALFYHCGKNHEPDGGVMCADKPCSCAPHRKFWRWGCMTAMSLVLPCLCLYWPCKGCIHIAEKTYQRYHNNGCTCRSPPTSNQLQNRSNSPLQSQPHLLSQDEDRHHHCEPPHLNHPPEVTSRIGATKLLPSD